MTGMEGKADRGYLLIPAVSFLALLAYEACLGAFVMARGQEYLVQHRAAVLAASYLERVIMLVPIVWLLARRSISLGSIGLRADLRDAGLAAGLGSNLLLNAAAIALFALKAQAGKTLGQAYSGWLPDLIKLLMVAFTEEVFFRGVLQNVLRQVLGRPILSIPASALAFGLFHIAYLWFPALGLSAVVFTFAAGLIFALLYHFTGNLWWGFWLHFLLNFKAPLLCLMVALGQKV